MAIAAGIGVGGSLLGSYLQSRGVSDAAAAQAGASREMIDYLRRSGMDATQIQLWLQAQQEQTQRPGISQRMAAQNLLSMGLGIAPQGQTFAPGPYGERARITPSSSDFISGVSLPPQYQNQTQGLVPGTNQPNYVYGIPEGPGFNQRFGIVGGAPLSFAPQTGGLMTPGAPGATNVLAPGATQPYTGGPFNQGQLTLPGSGAIYQFQPGVNAADVFAPISAAPLAMTPEQQQAFTGSLLGAPSAEQIQAAISPEQRYITDLLGQMTAAKYAQSGMIGGGGFGSALANIATQGGTAGWESARNYLTGLQGQEFNMLQSFATGSPASVTPSSAPGMGAAGQLGTTGTNIAQAAAAGATPWANVAQGNIWGGFAGNLGNTLAKYYQNQPSGFGGGGWGGYYPSDPWSSATPYGQEF